MGNMETRDKQKYDILFKMIEEIQDYAIIQLNLKGDVQNWNLGAERIKGYKQDEIIGKNFSLFYTESDRENNKPQNLLQQAKTTGRASDNGWRLRKDGSVFWGNIAIHAVYDAEGTVIGFGKVTRDLTEIKKAEHARTLEIKNKELEQFTYIASHDLQEPLRTVSNYIEVITEDYQHQLDAQALAHLGTIGAATKRMRVLVKALLDYSRLGHDRKMQLIDSKNVIKQVVSDLENLIRISKTIIEYTSEFPQLFGLEPELRQLFQNLITNAIKFGKKDIVPEIKIGCNKLGNQWQFSVTDNGIGIDPKNFERIFQIFQQLNTNKEYEGYGIGLANCKKIVELHGGSIWIESQPGVGTTFNFTI
jgi:PAS domain S-box-containing protein